MSMNLWCDKVDLLQTPTNITKMILYANLRKRKKSPWRTVMEKYLMWVRQTWPNDHEVIESEERKFQHVLRIYKKLKFEER